MHAYILIRCKWGELVDLEVTCHSRGMGSHMKWIFVFLFPFFQRWSRDPAPDLLKYLILIYWTNGTTIRDDWQWNRRLAYIRAWLLIVMSPEKRWMIWKAGIIAEWSYALTLGMRRNVMQSISSHFSSVFRCFAFDFGFLFAKLLSLASSPCVPSFYYPANKPDQTQSKIQCCQFHRTNQN